MDESERTQAMGKLVKDHRKDFMRAYGANPLEDDDIQNIISNHTLGGGEAIEEDVVDEDVMPVSFDVMSSFPEDMEQGEFPVTQEESTEVPEQAEFDTAYQPEQPILADFSSNAPDTLAKHDDPPFPTTQIVAASQEAITPQPQPQAHPTPNKTKDKIESRRAGALAIQKKFDDKKQARQQPPPNFQQSRPGAGTQAAFPFLQGGFTDDNSSFLPQEDSSGLNDAADHASFAADAMDAFTDSLITSLERMAANLIILNARIDEIDEVLDRSLGT